MHLTILADSVDNQSAGIHVYTKNLIQQLLKVPNLRLTLIHSQENAFFDGSEHYIIPRAKYPGSESIRRFIKIPRLIKRLNPDAVLEPCHIGPFNLPKHIKRILTVHDLTSILFPQHHTFRNRFIHRLLLDRSLRNANLILTPSQTTKADIVAHYSPAAPIASIPLGTNLPEENTSPAPKNPYFLYLGTIEPRKNLKTLVTAFNQFKKETSLPHKLILAGKIGWKSDDLLAKIADNPDIILKNYVSESQKSQLLHNAAAFVYPSLYEGFGLPPQEAIAHGTPVICSTGGALKELYSTHALTFEPLDHQTLKAHLKTILTLPRPHRKILHTWEEMAKRTLAEIEGTFPEQNLSRENPRHKPKNMA